MISVNCPDKQKLQLFFEGLLVSNDEIESIGLHLDQCQACLETISGCFIESNDVFYTDELNLEHLAEKWKSVEFEQAPKQIGKYRIEGELGRGGMSVVYRSTHPELKLPIAIKLLSFARVFSDSAKSRFFYEQELLGKLRHPSIVTALDAGVDNGTPFIVMELVDGRTLAELVNANEELDLTDACAIAAVVADALQAVHNAGYVHRDVKPGNIVLTNSGVVKLLDLGLAFPVECGDPTNSNSPVGTPFYVAPEQLDVDASTDRRADIYGLGATLFFLLTQTAPRDLRKRELALNDIESKLKDVPAPIRTLVARMLAVDPDDRPDTMNEVLQILHPWARRSEMVDQRFLMVPPEPVKKRRYLAWASGGAFFAVLAMWASLAVFKDSTSSRADRPNDANNHSVRFGGTDGNLPFLPGLHLGNNHRTQIQTVYPRPYPKNAKWNSDGTRVACFGEDGALRIFEVDDGKINSLQLLPCYSISDVELPNILWIEQDNKIVVHSSVHFDLQIWDVKQAKLLRSIAIESSIASMDWNRGTNEFAVGNKAGEIIIFSSDGARRRQTQIFPTDSLSQLAWNKSDSRLAAVATNGDIVILDNDLKTLYSTSAQVTSSSIAWHPSEREITVGTSEGRVLRYSDELNFQSAEDIGRGIVKSLAWHEDGNELAVGSLDAVIWNPETNSTTKLIESQTYHWSMVDWCKDRLLLASFDDGLVMWDQRNQTYLQLFGSQLQQVISLEWAPDRNSLAIGTMAGELYVADHKGKVIWHSKPDNEGLALGDVCWSASGKNLCAIQCWGARCFVWNALEKGPPRILTTIDGTLAACWGDQDNLFVSGTSGTLAMFDAVHGTLLCEVKMDVGIYDLSYEPETRRLAGATTQGVVVFELDENNNLHRKNTWIPDEAVDTLCWSPNGDVLAIGLSNGKLLAADGVDGRIIRAHDDPHLRARGITWSHSGHAVSCGNLGVFAFDSFSPIYPTVPKSGHIYAWNSDDRLFAEGNWINEVVVYEVKSASEAFPLWKLVLGNDGNSITVTDKVQPISTSNQGVPIVTIRQKQPNRYSNEPVVN